MAKQIINIGSSANKGDGEPLRTAFDKINDNFSELYLKVDGLTGGVGVTVGDIQGSVFADDSTVLVDAVNGTIPASVLTGALPAINGSALTNITTSFANISSKPTTVAGYGITDAQPAYVKAFGHVDVSAPINVETGSLNVASVTSGSTGIFDVTFTSALPTANYIVSLSVQTNLGSDDYTVAYYNRTTTGFQVKKFLNGNLDGGASGNFNFVVIQL